MVRRFASMEREKAFFIETHCHLAHKRYNHLDRKELWNKMQQAGIKTFIEIPIGYNTNYDMRKKLEGISQARYAVGVHPSRVGKIEPKDPWKQFRKWLQLENSVAIGEVGLDFHVPERREGWELQKEYFIKFLDLAIEFNKPLILHVRDAHESALSILKQRNQHYKGVIHCFMGSQELAKEYIQMGFLLGIGGYVTYDLQDLLETVKQIPLECMVLETDAPFITPKQMDGNNSPLNIPMIAETVAQIKGIDINTVAEQTTRNATEVFHLGTAMNLETKTASYNSEKVGQ